MKGAIGNAFIMNTVISFIVIFFMLLIGSMAYSKAYKSKNAILNLVEKYEENGKMVLNNKINNNPRLKEWDNEINEYLGRVGYPLTTNVDKLCGDSGKQKKQILIIGNAVGRYDYCVYKKYQTNRNDKIDETYNYIIKAYMKLDLPVIGKYIRIPVTGETKTYYVYK